MKTIYVVSVYHNDYNDSEIVAAFKSRDLAVQFMCNIERYGYKGEIMCSKCNAVRYYNNGTGINNFWRP